MAYTKIKAVKNNLSRCLNYTSNPQKTEYFSDEELSRLLHYTQNADKTEHQLYVTGFNCDPQNAFTVMQNTKTRWGKTGKSYVQGYHLIQSFKPGEVTPRQAFEIGCEFARRYLADRHEVTVSTHLDRAHLHCHIVFNSVSFVDGKMFRNDFDHYYHGIRKVSDELCRENHLSVIKPDGRGREYSEWRAEQTGQPTVRGMVREDVERALAKAVNWDTFVIGLKKQGYQLKYGPNVKYAAIRHREGKRWVRLKSLGPEYTEQAIRDRLAQRQVTPAPPAPHKAAPVYLPVPRRASYRCRGRFPLRPKQKITGFMALYYRYLYLLGKAKKRHSSKRTHYLLREDFLKFDRYQAQAKFLWEHNIQSDEDLAAQRESAQKQIAALTTQRKRLYRLRGDTSNCLNKSDLSAQITELTDQLRRLRKTVSLCDAIEADAARLRQQLTEAEQAERDAREHENQRKEKYRYEHWR